MCTTGVLRLGNGDYALFKNKDFGRTHFDDRIVVEPGVFGVEGITTWAGTDPDLDRFSGFSIGANDAGLLCCDSNVRTLDDHANYDDLVEIALRAGGGVAAGVAAVRAAVAARPYLWGNLVMIDAESAASVEVRSSHVEVAPLDRPTARSNHHVLLGATPDDDDTVTSELRLAAAQRRVGEATSLDDVFALQRAHDDGATGVCNHALHQTVYSYVLHQRGDTTTLHVSQGRPCEEPPRLELVLPLGARWSETAADRFRAGYPSARAMVRT